MTAISGTRRAMKEMADGTIRVQIDIDPQCRDTFLAMFGKIDMPVALAPLVADFEQKKEPEKGGQLSILAAKWCKDPKFWEFLGTKCIREEDSEHSSKVKICSVCYVASCRELDHNPKAAEKFHNLIRIPYAEYLKTH